MREWFEHSNRPTTDEGYAKFIRRLFDRIADGRKRHIVSSIPSVLRKRELGIVKSNRFRRSCFVSLMRSRTYCFTESHAVKGKVFIEKNIMVKNKEREVYDIEMRKRLCTITALRSGELIESCIYVDSASTTSEGGSRNNPSWLILLTRFGRVLFVNITDGTAGAVFILPTEEFRYRRICWCEAWRSFAVFGETKKSLNAMPSRHVVAVFRTNPITYVGLFILDKKNFGYASEIGAFSEFLVFFSMRPRRVAGYNISSFSTQRSTVVIDGEGAPCEEVLVDSVPAVTQVPETCFAFDGNWDSIEASISDTIYMLHPSTKRDSFLIGDWANRSIQIPFELRQPANLSIQVMDEHIFLHGDGSGRVLCVEGPFIICYYLRRTVNSLLAYVEQWRTRLWVDDSFFARFLQDVIMRSRSGRQIKLTPSTLTKDDRLALVDVHFDVDNDLIYVVCTCDMNSAVFDEPDCPSTEMSRRNRSEDRGCVVFILDSGSGDIINVIMQRAEATEALRTKFTTTGMTVTIGQRFNEMTQVVEVQQLMEMGVGQWRDGNCSREALRTKFTTTGMTVTIGQRFNEMTQVVEVQQLMEMGVGQWRDGNCSREVPSRSYGRRRRTRLARAI
ncbi:hypothetical protein Tcan_11890 [Toxocara canis]|uniref:Uncharacterized protein n=1 Tax=Toxocara canis TaxID=6265 RepID=A0A0B2VCM3_TOXCA|nr:hypothetical protein Tcan_11890 [Toxocara canis]